MSMQAQMWYASQASHVKAMLAQPAQNATGTPFAFAATGTRLGQGKAWQVQHNSTRTATLR